MFARLDDAARQRHLSAVPSERASTKREHDMWTPGNRKHQHQAGRIADAGAIEIVGPSMTRPRRKERLSRRPRKRRLQSGREPRDDFIEIHSGRCYRMGTIDMKLQSLCGAGYELDVTARTISPAMNA